MSHFSVLVIGPDPEALMARFDERREVPLWRDFSEFEDVRAPAEHWAFDECVLEGMPAEVDLATYGQVLTAMGMPCELDPVTGRLFEWSGWNPDRQFDDYDLSCQARKADLDVVGKIDRYAAEAVATHALVREVLAGHPRLRSYRRLRAELPWPAHADQEIDAAYRAQSGVQALDAAGLGIRHGCLVYHYHLDEADPLAGYVCDERAAAWLPYALATERGWTDREHLGWLAAEGSGLRDWSRLALEVVLAAPSEALFSYYSLHG